MASTPLSIDDVLETVAIDKVEPSPAGDVVAISIQRPARLGETYGRNAYEIDPSRSDIKIIDVATGTVRDSTDGRSLAAGFWCPSWSPDGKHLVMLSTLPEHGEPEGGDNVHLYAWDRASGRLSRLDGRAVVTQGRYGSGLQPLDFRALAGTTGGRVMSCGMGGENAPFTWVDESRLLTAFLAEGRTSALVDQYDRPFLESAKTRSALRRGSVTTAEAVGSGAEIEEVRPGAMDVSLTLVDLATGTSSPLFDVPSYPFAGALGISVSPDQSTVGLLATIGGIHPVSGVTQPFNVDEWHVRKRLGFHLLEAGGEPRWLDLPKEAELPFELLDWSPDSSALAFRARAKMADGLTGLFLAFPRLGTAVEAKGDLAVGGVLPAHVSRQVAGTWLDGKSLIIDGTLAGSDSKGWLISLPPGRAGPPLARAIEETAGFRILPSGQARSVASGRLIELRHGAVTVREVASAGLSKEASIQWPADSRLKSPVVVLGERVGTCTAYGRMDLQSGRADTPVDICSDNVMAITAEEVFWTDLRQDGSSLKATNLQNGRTRELLAYNRHLRHVKWGRRLTVDYEGTNGVALKAGVILPPDFREDKRYPVVTWVYAGYTVRGEDDYFLNPYLPGFYNLQLVAARGYVVVIPSIPLPRSDGGLPDYGGMSANVWPAVEKLVDLGIADESKVAVMGQSLGGFTVYSLIGQTDRFKAAIAMAGVTDLRQAYGEFDPLARGYSSIAHEKSVSWSIYENGYSFGSTPVERPDDYLDRSPLADTGRVATPLLMIQGELDSRAGLGQAETFFYQLYRQGKTARLVRYWGESHSLSNSPANVRNIHEEVMTWLDKYLKGRDSAR